MILMFLIPLKLNRADVAFDAAIVVSVGANVRATA
jgi:hypothetical protein